MTRQPDPNKEIVTLPPGTFELFAEHIRKHDAKERLAAEVRAKRRNDKLRKQAEQR